MSTTLPQTSGVPKGQKAVFQTGTTFSYRTMPAVFLVPVQLLHMDWGLAVCANSGPSMPIGDEITGTDKTESQLCLR